METYIKEFVEKLREEGKSENTIIYSSHEGVFQMVL